MRLLGEVQKREFDRRLAAGKLPIKVGPYTYGIQSNLPKVAAGLRALYADFVLAKDSDFVDYQVGISCRGLRNRMHRTADFMFDRQRPFETIPASQAYAFLEWGMNWCVSVYANEYLKLHAAAVAKDRTAVIMPGIPGAGKSTLCAALGVRGWRILSDEHAIIPPGTTDVVPLCRPVSLKNESIEAIRAFAPDAVLGPVSRDTHKGVVVHMKADMHPESHDLAHLPVAAMVFPRYEREETQRLLPRARSHSFILAAYHAFNYSLMGERGFAAMQTLVANVACYDLVYNDLDWAVQAMEQLPELEGA